MRKYIIIVAIIVFGFYGAGKSLDVRSLNVDDIRKKVISKSEITLKVLEEIFEAHGEAEIKNNYVRAEFENYSNMPIYIKVEEEGYISFTSYLICDSNVEKSKKLSFIIDKIIKLPLVIRIDKDGDIKLESIILIDEGATIAQISGYGIFSAEIMSHAKKEAAKAGILK